jgi:enoyl-CoA hydratase/carnithine racemase
MELDEVIEKMRIDAEGKMVIITGAGEEALVSGAKIKANSIRSISNHEGE